MTKFLDKWEDKSLKPPTPFQGKESIKLIILGRDPTVGKLATRKKVTTVLMLNEKCQLQNFVYDICKELGLTLDNIYATNLIKPFLKNLPCSTFWQDVFINRKEILDQLQNELINFQTQPIITLSDQVLPIVTGNQNSKVRDYWGYQKEWQRLGLKGFTIIQPQQNQLNRKIFPHIHQRTRSKLFYKTYWNDYLKNIHKNI